MRTLRILLVEDHLMVRKGIKLMLGEQKLFIAEIDEAVDGNQAISKATDNAYDVILLDINLPGLNGIETTKQLVKKLGKSKILGLSAHLDFYWINEMIKAGASGYVPKNIDIDELSEAVLTVADDGTYFSEEVENLYMAGNNELHYKEREDSFSKKDHRYHLTKRELEILFYITKGHTNKNIAEILNISDRTVGNHRYRLIQKLHLKNSIELAAFAIKNELI